MAEDSHDPVEAVRDTVERAANTQAGRKAKRVWPDIFNLAIGGWMVLSAFVPMFSGPPPGPLACALSGGAVCAISIAAILRVERWKEGINLVLGLWLIAAPFVLGIHGWNPVLNFTTDGGLLVIHAAYQTFRPPWRRVGKL